jgi:hypothetical protein
MITRGGTNNLQLLFEYFRNSQLDANSWANNRSNQSGRFSDGTVQAPPAGHR